MIQKTKEKEKAIKLRKKGMSYREILKEVSVAKSTLSLWLRDVSLAKEQKQKLTQKKLMASRKGGEIRHQQKIERIQFIEDKAKVEINEVSKKELWLMGIMLYWAEGSKEKEWGCGQNIRFSNSDVTMIKFFIRWLKDIFDIKKDRIVFGIYIHENHKSNIEKVKKYWASEMGLSMDWFKYVYYKKHNPKTKRKNTGSSYYGLLRLTVRASSDLNRKISGWIKGICEKNL